MKKLDLELSVGLFILAGILCLGYLSVNLARMEVMGGRGYEVYALFTNVGGLKKGAQVVIAGVDVGRVKGVAIEDFRAKVSLSINQGIEIPEDTIASIRTRGLIGEKFVNITPGGSEEMISPGGRIWDTEPAVDLEELISKFAFGEV
jgi:phospholipid/cholesterol/gamma-HCH transport system substrate-binding protein